MMNNPSKKSDLHNNIIIPSNNIENTNNNELDSDEEIEWEEWKPERISFGNHMIAGSLAGLAEHVCLFPMDTIKTHIQCQKCGSVSPFQTWSYTIKMIHHEGLFRLWRGVTAMFAGCIPAHAAYFTVYESMKRFLQADDHQTHTPFRAGLCGATAAMSHDLFLTPFDTIKQRMQLGYYTSTTQCLRTIVRTEGLSALYLSFPTTLAMNIPHGWCVVALNESAKRVLNPTGGYNIPMSLLSGCLAGGLSAMLTTPLDVIKTRLQTQDLVPCSFSSTNSIGGIGGMSSKPVVLAGKTVGTLTTTITTDTTPFCLDNTSSNTTSNTGKLPPASASTSSTTSLRGNVLRRNAQAVRQIVQRIWSTEGVAGFYRGAVPRMLTQAPAVAISWTVYEGLKSLLVGNNLQYNNSNNNNSRYI